MRHFGETPPWDGTYTAEGRILHWTRDEPLWDGTPVWRLVDQEAENLFSALMRRILPSPGPKIAWLEDDFMAGLERLS